MLRKCQGIGTITTGPGQRFNEFAAPGAADFDEPGLLIGWCSKLAEPGAANLVEPGLLIGQVQQPLLYQPITATCSKLRLIGPLFNFLNSKVKDK